MFDWFSKDGNDAVSILKRDHDTVQELFDEFEKAKQRPAKKKIVTRALTELKVHAALEEEIFYPAVRPKLAHDLMNEADEEHHARLTVIQLLASSFQKDATAIDEDDRAQNRRDKTIARK